MRRFLKALTLLGFACAALIFGLLGFAERTVPDELYVAQDRSPWVGELCVATPEDQAPQVQLRLQGNTAVQAQGYDVEVKLLNLFPVKNSHVTVTQRHYVVPGGIPFGLRLYTNGVVIVGMDSVETREGNVNPAKEAGLKEGDVIVSMDGQSVSRNEDVSRIFRGCGGHALQLRIRRGTQEMDVKFQPACSASDGKFRAGLWIRDSSAGVGMLTFYDPESRIFAGLGHAICDVDTGEEMPLLAGDIVDAHINGCYKGTKGAAGELCGVFGSKVMGTLTVNGNTGVYGFMNASSALTGKAVPVALRYEVKTGPAQIIATVDGKAPQYYDVEITKIYSGPDTQVKNMIVEVTDEALIQKTGGIVQGMSGSPILQNGMLVGAVTHVFVNNPLQGYGIFAENMLHTAENVVATQEKKAS